jgi:hypothetical protein
MITDVHNKPSPTATSAVRRVLAFALLASALCCLVGMVVLATTTCSALLGVGSSFGLFEFVLAGGSALAFALLGAVIVAYQPRNRIGWLCSAIGVTFALALFGDEYADCAISGGATLPAAALMAWIAYLAFPATILLMFSLLPFLFPDGRFVSPRWRRLAQVTTVLLAASILLTAVVQGPLVHSGVDANYDVDNPFGLLPAALGPLLAPATLLAIAAASMAGIVSLAVRLRRSRGEMRQQLKLLLYFLAAAIAVQLAIEVYGDMVDEVIFSGWVYYLVLSMTFWGFPLVIGLAVFKYRLWDIDVVIRKTLVYSVLTALLALIYFGVVIVLQSLFSRLAGVQQSTLAVVISTLAIAALFTPLRRRIQDAIDRRFYRKKYNAQQVLAQFAQTARDETDLDALLAELVRVVDETLQPEHVSIWLKDPRR